MPVANRTIKQCTRCRRKWPVREFIDKKNRERRLCARCRQTRINHVDVRTEKQCPTCKEVKPISEFCKRGDENNPHKFVWHRCRSCNAIICNERMRKRIESGEARQDYKEVYRKKRWKRLLKQYGISQDEYEQLESEQDFKCAICNQPETRMYKDVLCRLVVDHDHKTKRIRGLLCYNCNIGLGNFKDDPKRLISAATYLGRN